MTPRSRYADRADGLRAWARGLLPLEAAVELLVCSHGGRLLDGPWIRRDEGGPWFDAALVDGGAVLSGGERRVLDIAVSLAGGPPVSLDDVLTGLDGPTLDLVLAALAHAGGR